MAKKVRVVGDKRCGHCQDAMHFLKENKVKYSFTDVNTRGGNQFFSETKAEGIPLIQVCDVQRGKTKSCSVLEGFDAKWLTRKLDL